jgi:8-oxo-dGTP pyrophosphatase MutT (NUDIX family)
LDHPTTTPLPDPFLIRLAELLSPVDGWGAFRRGARTAAVTAVFYKRSGEWRVPFVLRRDDLPDHPGQVALPGGRVRVGEDAWEGAAREVAEEIGVQAADLVPIGAGPPIYAAVTNYSVVPFVAWLDDPDPGFVHDSRELVGVLEIPLVPLLDDTSWPLAADPRFGRYFLWQGSTVWGLTARILADLLPSFRQAWEGS